MSLLASRHTPGDLSVRLGAVLLASLTSLASQTPAVVDAHYTALTNNHRSFTNFNPEVVRGFVVVGDDLFAINSYASSIVRHTNFAAASGVVSRAAQWRTLANPVSIAHFAGSLYVVGQGNHALARHSLVDGAMLDVLKLPSEPADIVIDRENGWAWVSCMGGDSVVQVSLSGPMAVIKRWSWADGLRLKRPRFLALDLGGSGAADNGVLVAPLVSGNNTLITNLMETSPDTSSTNPPVVRDGRDVAVFPNGGLPDEDLFSIQPTASVPVRAVVRGAGSLILAHGQNPTTGEYWLLNVEHHNLAATSEPALRGVFASNRLTRATLSATQIVGPSAITDLDDLDPTPTGVSYASDRSLSFPYALAFDGATGRAAIAGATTPLVVLTDAAGARGQELKLQLGAGFPAKASGLVPRTLRFQGSDLLVYCQQTSNLMVFDVSGAAPSWVATLMLGNDPTPGPIQLGRAIFYDATLSANGRTTCNTCHPGGGADGLAWQIEDAPVDHKGPMTTQPLFGIEDTFPYHWRGERALADFNVAFPGLLGHAQALNTAAGGQLDQFMEFLFSLSSPANPLQHLNRKLRDHDTFDQLQLDILPGAPVANGDPIRGSQLFHDPAVRSDSNGHCAVCHMDPTGSNGDFNVELQSPIGTRSVFKVSHLDTQLALKHQPLVDVNVNWPASANSFKSNLLGSGTAHTGQILNVPTFVHHFFRPFLGSDLDVADIAAFVMMFDTGTAPAAHHAVRLNTSSPASALAEIQDMVDQAMPRTVTEPRGGGVGIVVIGKVPYGAGQVDMTWYFDPSLTPPAFVPANAQPVAGGATLLPQPLAFFVNQPLADNFFLGTPPGNERRLGADFDNDGLDLFAEQQAGTDPWKPDHDNDGWTDGVEVANASSPTSAASVPGNAAVPDLLVDTSGANAELDFVNASQAKIHFHATEPVRWRITLHGLATHTGQPPVALPDVSSGRLSFDTRHTALVHGLVPSTFVGTSLTTVNSYSGEVELVDAHGATRIVPLVFRTKTSPATSFFDTANNLPLATVGRRALVPGDLAWERQMRRPGEFEGLVRIVVDKRIDAPDEPPSVGTIVVAQLLKLTAAGWQIVPASDISLVQNPTLATGPGTNFAPGSSANLTFRTGSASGPIYTALPGPFLLLPATDSQGVTRSEFRVTNLNANEKVRFNILAIDIKGPGYTPAFPVMPSDLLRYQMPATPSARRGLGSTQ